MPDDGSLDRHHVPDAVRAGQFGIQSVEVAGGLLQALLQADGPQRLADLSRAAGMASAKAHRYLVSLIRIGLASQDAAGLYDLGPVALQLGLKGFERFPPLRLAETRLRALVEEVGETAALVMWGAGGPGFVRMVEARHAEALQVAPQHICPLTWSASGLVFCAFEEPGRIQRRVADELAQSRRIGRPRAPHDAAALAAMLEGVRARGYATSLDGGGEGIGAVSAPVFDVTGRLSMAVTVFGRAARVDPRPEGRLAPLVAEAAAKLSSALGFRPA